MIISAGVLLVITLVVLLASNRSTIEHLKAAQEDKEVLEWLLAYYMSMKNAMQDYIAESEGTSYLAVRQKVTASFDRLMTLPHLLPSAPVSTMPKHLQEAAMRYNAQMRPMYRMNEGESSTWDQMRLESVESVVNTMPAHILSLVDSVAETANVDVYATSEVLREAAVRVSQEFASRLGMTDAEAVLPSRY